MDSENLKIDFFAQNLSQSAFLLLAIMNQKFYKVNNYYNQKLSFSTNSNPLLDTFIEPFLHSPYSLSIFPLSLSLTDVFGKCQHQILSKSQPI
jgi:hypothetical protein